MLKLIETVSATIFIFLLFSPVGAEVITLKSGKVIDGEIVERANDCIKVKYNGYEIYYENKYIKNIGGLREDVPAAITQKEKIAEDTTLSLKKGMELASAGKFDEARKELENQLNGIKGGLSILDAVEKGSISKEYATYLFQGSLHIINGEYNLAVASLEKAWEINPKDPDVNYNLGFVYYSLGEYKKSALYLYVALKLQPDDTEAYELLAKAHYNIGKYQKAKESLLMARELFKKSGDEDSITRMNSLLDAIPPQTNN
ncbi:MAG: tetratricopeptide repeat protein [Candidatus Omnitrophota bacterium]|jgi:tetratricopeptide (TPR) repeat protein